MAEHNDLGKIGEQKACEYLLNKGYDILQTNYRYLKAEIDIIAQIKDTLVIVEVKTRQNNAYGNPEAFVNNKKIKLLVKAANAFVEQNDLDVEVRFDIVAITIKPQLHIEHIEEAYYYF